MRIIYMGTPDFAVPALECLVKSRHEVVAVVTQPDKAKGRSGKVQYTPVKEYALKKGLPVLQPERVKDEAFHQELEKYQPDAIVVAAFGQILPESVLGFPKYGCLNIHASLLPKYRGAAPIQWAVINGEKETGITIMQMDAGVDTGDILNVCRVALREDETGGSLFDTLAQMGGPLLLETLEKIEDGSVIRTPQKHEEHTYAKMLSKETGCLDFNRSAAGLECMVRGLNPWPSAYTKMNGKTLKIWKARVVDDDSICMPGTVIKSGKDTLLVKCGEGALAIEELQLEGKKRMDTGSFLRGCQIEEGTVLGV